jgi:phosphatidyl-myo-inositol dimannoside synthase
MNFTSISVDGGVAATEMLLIAAQSFRGSNGGIARVCELTARVAGEAGYPVSLLSVQDERGSFQGSQLWRGCGGSRVRFLTRCWKAGLGGDRIMYDQLGTARAHVHPMKIAKPCGVWIHGVEVWSRPRKDRIRAAYRMAYIAANSNFTRMNAIRHAGIFESARVCWLATIEDETPLEPARLDGPPTVLIVGRLDPIESAYKGHKELIEIWPSVVNAVPGARLIMIGSGPSLEWHRSLAAASRAANFIDVLGFVPESAMAAWWRRAIVFAMPSRGEGFGLAYIEAMRWGVPVIASVHDAGQEVNANEMTGYNINLDRQGELRERIVELLKDRDLSRKFGAAAQSRWRKHFRYGAFKQRFEKELEYFARL